MTPEATRLEAHVCGAMMLDNGIIPRIRGIVSAEDFSTESGRRIFAEIIRLADTGTPADESTVSAATGIKWEIVAALSEGVPTAANAHVYATQVAVTARARRLREALEAARDAVRDAKPVSEDDAAALFADVQQAISKASEFTASKRENMTGVLGRVLKTAQERHATRGQLPGFRTGFSALDDLLLGLRRKHLVVVGAKTGVGKTAFALGAARGAARSGARVFFCSYEMGAEELGLRLLAAESRVPSIRIETGTLEAQDFTRLMRGQEAIGNATITLTDTPPQTIARLRGECHAIKAREGLDVVVVDYLQLMQGSGEAFSREREIAEISRGLKLLAMELDVCVVALSQLNRKNDRHVEPTLSDLRDSGSIEQDANSVVFLWTEADDAPTVRFTVAKNRGAQLGRGELKFVRPIVRFEAV